MPEIQNYEGMREAGMMTTTGVQGAGKTFQNMHLIHKYTLDKPHLKIRGRRFLIFDVNGEFVEEEFAKNGIPDFKVKRIALRDVVAWCASGTIECRRIDAKNVGIPEKKAILEYLISNYRNGGLCVEDINNYLLDVTHEEKIVGGLINLRHRAVDTLLSYQSLRPVEPRILQNSRWIRLHYDEQDVEEIKGKISNRVMMKIAQLIVNEKYFNGDKRAFVYIYNFDKKIEGNFTKEEFRNACAQYLNLKPRLVKDYGRMYNTSPQDSIVGQTNRFYEQFYGNSDK